MNYKEDDSPEVEYREMKRKQEEFNRWWKWQQNKDSYGLLFSLIAFLISGIIFLFYMYF